MLSPTASLVPLREWDAYLCEFFLETADKRKQKTKLKQNKNSEVMKPQWISRAEPQNAFIFLWELDSSSIFHFTCMCSWCFRSWCQVGMTGSSLDLHYFELAFLLCCKSSHSLAAAVALGFHATSPGSRDWRETLPFPMGLGTVRVCFPQWDGLSQQSMGCWSTQKSSGSCVCMGMADGALCILVI